MGLSGEAVEIGFFPLHKGGYTSFLQPDSSSYCQNRKTIHNKCVAAENITDREMCKNHDQKSSFHEEPWLKSAPLGP
uniref:Uncharacterized protein n=1 Tax=Arundo donax TaxID=35708 RepID=A0A0A8XN29_ARUDO